MERVMSRQNTNLMHLVYGESVLKIKTTTDNMPGSSEDEEDDGEFFKPKGEGIKVCLVADALLY